MALMKTHVSYFASFVAVSAFEMSYLSPALSAVCRSVTDLYMAMIHHFYRICIPWMFRFILVPLIYFNSCSCLCWGHASSLAFENITL
ncbi:hypothetical protein EV702DRAFT_1113328, partial [Suillus placidus]